MILRENASSLFLNDTEIPGVFESVNVNGKLIIDAKNMEGGSGKEYQVNGFDDAQITFTIRLIDDMSISDNLIKSLSERLGVSNLSDSAASPYLLQSPKTKEQSLADLTSLFKQFNESGEPVIYFLDFPQAQAWRLQGCLFTGLDTFQSGGKQEIKANLRFMEYRPETAKVQQQKRRGEALKSTLALIPVPSLMKESEQKELKRLRGGI